jgi:tetratricopeptide (TPR) repeat protein
MANFIRLFTSAALAAFMALAQEGPEQILQRAVALHQSGDVEKAIPLYREFLKLQPQAPPQILSNFGAALASTGRYDEAITEYRQALKGLPGDPRIRLNFSLALYKSGQISDAAKELEALHTAQPDNLQVTELLADCWLRQGQNKKVVGLLTPVDAANHADLAVAYMLGTALLQEKDLPRGQQMIDRILRNGDSAEARFLMATAKMDAMDFTGAVADLQKAAALNPNLPDVYYYLGQAHKEVGDQAAARKDFEKEIAQNPNDFGSNLNLAMMLKEDSDVEGAKRLLDRALRVRPGDPGALYQLATMDLEAGKFEDARIKLEGILKASPQFIEAHISLATVYYRLKRKQDGDREKALVQQLNAEKDAKEARDKDARDKDKDKGK